MNYGDPNIHVPFRPRPGCLEALRAKLAGLQGCLTAWLVRALWMLLGGVIGAVLVRGCER